MIGTVKQILILFLLCSCLVGCRSAAGVPREEIAKHAATTPVSRSERWAELHLKKLREAEELGVELLFLGDSITNQWRRVAPGVWDEFYGERKAYNLGSGGDRTEHTLWRVEHGELERLQPRLIVLLIGTNNLVQKGDAVSNTPREIADGIHATVRGLRRKLPETHILVHAVFPRGRGPQHRQRPKVAAISTMLAELAEQERVHFLDIGDVFLDENGFIPSEIMPDALHLSPQGYRLWSESIEETVSAVFAEPR